MAFIIISCFRLHEVKKCYQSSRVMSIFGISSRKHTICNTLHSRTNRNNMETICKKTADLPELSQLIHYHLYLRLIWLKTPIDVIAILSQLSGALAWPILQWSGNYQAEVRLSHPWALPAGLLLGKRIKNTKQRILFSPIFSSNFSQYER